jgi:hypothetical protein
LRARPPDPFQKRRVEAAIDACAVWTALFLTYISVGILLAWKFIRALQRVFRLKGGDADL